LAPDHGGEGEQALGDADEHAGRRASTVGFEVELALEGVEPGRLALAVRALEVRAELLGDEGFDRSADEAARQPGGGRPEKIG
jgi:hypothetical protein